MSKLVSDAGKLRLLDTLLPKLKAEGHKVCELVCVCVCVRPLCLSPPPPPPPPPFFFQSLRYIWNIRDFLGEKVEVKV